MNLIVLSYQENKQKFFEAILLTFEFFGEDGLMIQIHIDDI